MEKDWLNASGCYDPTAYKAIKNVEYMPLIYICSPFSGDINTNVNNARKYARFGVEEGVIPLPPHLLFPQFMDDEIEDERRLAMRMNLILLDRCKELWVFGDIISEGMAEEIERAKQRQMPIRYYTEDLVEVV